MGSMIIDLVCIILAMVSGISNALMDKLNFHFTESIFSNFKSIFWKKPKLEINMTLIILKNMNLKLKKLS